VCTICCSGDDGDAELRAALDDIVKIEKSSVKWCDVAGLELAKEALHEAVGPLVSRLSVYLALVGTVPITKSCPFLARSLS
jgi:SpoVK/Ycf46/Vps4 family AAA+-type ATPase